MAKNTIKLKKYSDVIEEYEAASEITPGDLVELTSAGKIQRHSLAKHAALPMFALEDELQGNGIDDDFAADDVVQVWVPNRGDIVLAGLADGQHIEIGTFLVSNGAGKVQAYDATYSGHEPEIETSNIVGVAVEHVDLSGTSHADPARRIAMRVI